MSPQASPDLEMVEWHDSRLGSIEESAGVTTLRFPYLLVFRRTGVDKYSVEHCAGTLSLTGAHLDGAAYDVDLAGCDIDGPCQSHEVQRLLVGAGPGTLELLLADARLLKTPFTWATLVLDGPFVHLEDWDGPLFQARR